MQLEDDREFSDVIWISHLKDEQHLDGILTRPSSGAQQRSNKEK